MASNIEKVIDKSIESIWLLYDQDHSGYLDKDETKKFVQNILNNAGENNKYSESNFEKCFKEFDMDGSGTISKDEMK